MNKKFRLYLSLILLLITILSYKSFSSSDDLDIIEKFEKLGFNNKCSKPKIILKSKNNIVRTKLFLGGGDLSYELSFAQKHPNYTSQMVVTTYVSVKEMNTLYDSAAYNEEELRASGVKVFHGIDARKLEDWDKIRKGRIVPKDIYFSHPHTGARGTTSQLINDFFKSAALVQVKGNLLHIPRMRGGQREKAKYNIMNEENTDKRRLISKSQGDYGFRALEEIKAYKLIKKIKFSEKRYPGWKHRMTKEDKDADGVQKLGSIEYVFKRRNEPSKWKYKDNDSDIDSSEDSVTYSSDENNNEKEIKT